MTAKKQQSILIVEDELSLRTALRDKFVREGFIVFDAKDGEQGLMVALRERPQLILLDMMMPKMDGMAMLEVLRARKGWSKTVPVIVLTNFGTDDKTIMKKISNDEAAQYLVKSNWTMNQLVEKASEALTKAPGRATS